MLFRLLSFIKYFLRAQTIYRIHSPRIFNFITAVFDTSKEYYDFGLIEQERAYFHQSDKEIIIQDFGAGSWIGNSRSGTRRISEIAKYSSSDRIKCRLLFNLMRYSESNSSLELGTNLGLSGAYLAKARKNSALYTVEGDPKLYQISASLFERLKLRNVKSYLMEFDNYLQLNSDVEYGFVYIDGNHRYEKVVQYFRETYLEGRKKQVIIIDDINWSKGMQKAWQQIKSEMKASISIDIFKIGIILADPKIIEVQHLSYIPWKFKPWQIGLFASVDSIKTKS